MFDYLPGYVITIINSFDISKITEIRLRVGKPLTVQIDGNYFEVNKPSMPKISISDIQSTLARAMKHSVYAYSDTIKRGYIYGDDGERIGLAGTCVYDGEEIRNLKDIQSLCVRIPHEIIGCADYLSEKCFSCGLKSLLIISPPGCGKTTFLRDAARLISDKYKQNVLVIDEKNELSAGGKFNLGKFTDILSSCKKDFGFYTGVLNLCPNVIITDELFTEADIAAAKKAVLSGVRVLASAHASCVDELKKKDCFSSLLSSGIFDYVVVLNSDVRKRGVKEIVIL